MMINLHPKPKLGVLQFAIKHSRVRYPDVLIFTVTGKLLFFCLELGGPCTRGPDFS